MVNPSDFQNHAHFPRVSGTRQPPGCPRPPPSTRTPTHATPARGVTGSGHNSNGGPCYAKSRNKLFVHSRYTVMISQRYTEKKGVRPHASGSNAPCKGPSEPIHSYEQLFSIYSHCKILNFLDVLFTSRLIGAPIYWVVLLSQKRESKIFGSDKRVPCQIMCCSPMC